VASLEKFGEFRSFGGKIRFGRLHGFGAGGQIGLACRVLRFAFSRYRQREPSAC